MSQIFLNKDENSCTRRACHGLQFYFVLPSSYDIFTKTLFYLISGHATSFVSFCFLFLYIVDDFPIVLEIQNIMYIFFVIFRSL